MSRIEPRQVILESGEGEQVRLELQIHDAMIDSPPMPPPGTPESKAGQSAQNAAEEGQPMTRAEEIRQRIAERREELKRAAEEGGEEPTQSKPLDYRQAIQQMMQGRKDQETDESEQ